MANGFFVKCCNVYASEQGEKILGWSAFEWLNSSFKNLQPLPQNFSLNKITLILNCKYPAFSSREAERLVRLAARLNKNINFAAGKILVPNAQGEIFAKAKCGGKGSGALNLLARRCVLAHIKNGVEFCGTQNVFIDATVKIGKGAVICAPCRICGDTQIDKNAYVGANSYINNSHICSLSQILASTIAESKVLNGSKVGPYAHIRKNSQIGENCRVGDFVEIKNSRLGAGVKVAHLAYVGDAILGTNVNVGCGVVFANYDGKNKHISVVEDDVFLGSNCNIVAPVHINRGAFIAAGTTVCQNVEEYGLCIGRVREKTIKGGALGRYKNG